LEYTYGVISSVICSGICNNFVGDVTVEVAFAVMFFQVSGIYQRTC